MPEILCGLRGTSSAFLLLVLRVEHPPTYSFWTVFLLLVVLLLLLLLLLLPRFLPFSSQPKLSLPSLQLHLHASFQ
jgi:hypothetical protein